MITVKRNATRGKTNIGWLKSHHSFSFGSYYDKNEMGFSALRVINDDEVSANAGFETHGHRDMEIISYVLKGSIAHRDSEGNVTTLPAGEFQLMSAGSGIRHSEFNPSATEPLHFLQIWIQPNVYGQVPGYQQKDFGANNGLTLVASADGENGSLQIKQDARLFQLLLLPHQTLPLNIDAHRKYYVHLIEGELSMDEARLTPGDGAKIEAEKHLTSLSLEAGIEPVKALVFDLPE